MGHAFALDAETGDVIWKRDTAQEEGTEKPRWGFAGSALADGDRVIFNATSGGLCLDRKTGKTLWKTGGEKGGYATPVPVVLGGKKRVAIFGPQTLTTVDPVDGSVVWKTERPQPIGLNAADPVVGGTRVFVSAGRRCGGAVYDVAGDAKPLWDNRNMNNHWQSCVLWKGHIYGCEGNNAAGAGRSPNALRCLDWQTGEIKWEEASVGFFGLIVVDGKLLMLTDPGMLIAAEASPAGYKEIGRAQVIDEKCFAAPVYANDCVYARNTEGDVVRLDMR
jgi:outer membrane protein assembly factor BamB